MWKESFFKNSSLGLKNTMFGETVLGILFTNELVQAIAERYVCAKNVRKSQTNGGI